MCTLPQKKKREMSLHQSNVPRSIFTKPGSSRKDKYVQSVTFADTISQTPPTVPAITGIDAGNEGLGILTDGTVGDYQHHVFEFHCVETGVTAKAWFINRIMFRGDYLAFFNESMQGHANFFKNGFHYTVRHGFPWNGQDLWSNTMTGSPIESTVPSTPAWAVTAEHPDGFEYRPTDMGKVDLFWDVPTETPPIDYVTIEWRRLGYNQGLVWAPVPYVPYRGNADTNPPHGVDTTYCYTWGTNWIPDNTACTYEFRIKFTNLNGTSQTSPVLSVPVPGEGRTNPDQPTWLATYPQATGTTSIDLSWTIASVQPGLNLTYNIERSTNASSGFATIATGVSGSAIYSDTDGLSPGTTYYYKITAVDDHGLTSAASAVGSVQTNSAAGGTTYTMTLALFGGSTVTITPNGNATAFSLANDTMTWIIDPTMDLLTHPSPFTTADIASLGIEWFREIPNGGPPQPTGLVFGTGQVGLELQPVSTVYSNGEIAHLMHPANFPTAMYTQDVVI